jgi:selenocysteine lyase/cysteine desulfurase
MAMVNIDDIRRDFPALGEWVYLDNAFVGLMSRQVRKAYDEWADEWYNFDVKDKTILSGWLERAEGLRGSIATFVGLGAVRYALVDVDSSKPVTFTWERVLKLRNKQRTIRAIHACSGLQCSTKSRQHKCKNRI